MNDQVYFDGTTLPRSTASLALDSHLMASIVDAQGHFIWVSDSLSEMSGYSRDELSGQPITLLKGNDGEPDHDAGTQIRRCLSEGLTLSADLCRKRKDGREYWTRATLVPDEGSDSSSPRCHLLETDITATREAMAAAEYANQAKSAYLANKGHDLRTPLNAILGFAQILQFDDLNNDQQDSVEEISVAARRLSDMLADVLDLARIDSGQVELAREPVALAHLIGECLDELEPAAEAAGVTLAADDAEPITIQADPMRVKQVLTNLLSNAINYNRPDGWVRISLEQLDGERLRLTISDNGSGISAQRQSRIFQPIAAEPGPHQGRQTGTGTGLYIARRLLELMGGDIGFESEPGHGSRFWLELPRA